MNLFRVDHLKKNYSNIAPMIMPAQDSTSEPDFSMALGLNSSSDYSIHGRRISAHLLGAMGPDFSSVGIQWKVA